MQEMKKMGIGDDNLEVKEEKIEGEGKTCKSACCARCLPGGSSF